MGNDAVQHTGCQQYDENERRKEGNDLFNNALNTFYLRLYDVGYIVKEHSDSEEGHLLLSIHELLFLISSLCYTSCGAMAGRRNSSMGPPRGIDPMTMSGCYTMELRLTPKNKNK